MKYVLTPLEREAEWLEQKSKVWIRAIERANRLSVPYGYQMRIDEINRQLIAVNRQLARYHDPYQAVMEERLIRHEALKNGVEPGKSKRANGKT